MPVSRRNFIRSSVYAGAGLMFASGDKFNSLSSASMFGVHPFILHNPDAVFIMKTNVDVKTNHEAIKSAGLDFGRSVFGLTDITEEGIPLTNKIVIKPNLTCRQRDRNIYTRIGSMGIVTDAYFVEGIIESLKELNIQSDQFYIREVNCPEDFADGDYNSMALRNGINLRGINTPVQNLNADEVQWVDVPHGVYFKRIPYLWPVNAPGTFLLNIAKFKAHSMGLTLCAKNLQGAIAMNYQAHCTYGNEMSGVMQQHVSYTSWQDITDNYNRHVSNGIPRWDKPGESGGLWQETWATRCLDNNSATIAGLHIIEGVYGRDGNFMDGPGQFGLATDYMTNYIIFGKNQFCVDIIGHYLGGHEPGNFGLFHMAKERGMISDINPMQIPVYEWAPGTAPITAALTDFVRYPLKTRYLQRNYNGYTEPEWHLVNEFYDYDPTGISDISTDSSRLIVGQNFPNPADQSTSIVFSIPRNGHVLTEIINSDGQVIEVVANEFLICGEHRFSWDSSNHPSGFYLCRIRFQEYTKAISMIVSH